MSVNPSDYKKRYEAILVPSKDGTPVPISVNRYRLKGYNFKDAAAKTFRDTLTKRGIDTELRVDTANGTTRVDPRLTQHADELKRGRQDLVLSGQGLGRNDVRVDTRVVNWDELSRFVFAGKGSPEACQVVLQLAMHWGLTDDPQDYANNNLGLDCNGFVGNYLWHVRRNKPWTDLGVRNQDLGPDSPIKTGFYDHYQGGLIATWEALQNAKTYIMMRVGQDNRVINQGSGEWTAHIVITEPGGRQDRAGKGGKNTFAVKVIESTAGSNPPGLSESYYSCRAVNNKIFDIDRESMVATSRYKLFMIARID